MPADESLPKTSSIHHGSASKPYPCHAWPKPPGAAWALDHGYCRHSLDTLHGSSDPRCPQGCPHKAPEKFSQVFDKHFQWRGGADAAKVSREHWQLRNRE